MEVKRDKHESYGLLQISRATGGDNVFFGSSIKHHNAIILTITRASVDRDLHQDWYHSEEELITVEMSPSQFADAITSLNVGVGVPVTINRINMKRMAECPFTGKAEQFQQEISGQMEEESTIVDDALGKAQAMLKGDRLSKADLKELTDKLVRLKQDLAKNIPFIQSQLARQMDKTVTEAKAEVEAFVSGMIRKTGLDALRAQAPKLLEGEKENK